MDLKQLNVEFKRLKAKRRELLAQPNYKDCFTCRDVKIITDFEVNTKKYQRPQQKGVNINCKKCNNERSNQQSIEGMESTNIGSTESNGVSRSSCV